MQLGSKKYSKSHLFDGEKDPNRPPTRFIVFYSILCYFTFNVHTYTNYLLLLCHQGHKLGKTQSVSGPNQERGKLRASWLVILLIIIYDFESFILLSPCLSTGVLERTSSSTYTQTCSLLAYQMGIVVVLDTSSDIDMPTLFSSSLSNGGSCCISVHPVICQAVEGQTDD